MRRVLLVAYYFPPSVDAGAKRSLGFFRHLEEHGFEPTVLTVRDGNYATSDDDTWTDPPRVVRVAEARYPWQRGAPAGRAESAAASGRGTGVVRRIVRDALYVPDAWRGFHRPSLAAARRLHAECPFDVVWMTSSPWTHLRTGAALRRHGLPWVADLRDSWLHNWNGYPHGALRRALDARLERRWLARASAITTADEGLAATLRREALGPSPTAVRNGFLEVAGDEPPARTGAGFRIVYAGRMYDHPALSSGPLLDVLAAWRVRAPDEFARVSVDLFGRVDPGFGSAVTRRGLGDTVRFHGLVSRARVLTELRTSDVVLGIAPRHRRGVVPTKIYDAFGALVPLLLLGPPDGEAAAILRDISGGATFAPDDTCGALAWIRGRFAAGPENAAAREERRARVARYSYASLAGELASVLASVCA